MRMPFEAASFKKFFGSDFLSDFTLIIRCEGATDEAAPTAADATENSCSLVTSGDGSEQGLEHNTDHAAHTVVSATPATPPVASRAASLTGLDSALPCSGQHDSASEAETCCTSQEHTAATAPPVAAAAAAALANPLVTRNSANSLAQCKALQVARSSTLVNSSGIACRTANHSNSSSTDSSTGTDIGSITIPVHGVVLAAASPYFETLLRDWKSSSNTLHMVVADEQIQAAQVLLGFMYTSSVPSNLSQHDLLQLLLLADRFDVRRAAAAASRVLGCLSPASLEWSTLTGIWSLPDHLFEADEQSPVRVVAWDRLLQLFGDLEDSWATADGRSLWQQLPLRAVMALVASDALAVASENTVFAALSSWIAHAVGVYGRQLTQHDLRLLAASVRLPSMGPCYLSYVALQHDWYRQAIDISALARAAAFSSASNDVRKDISSHTETTLKQARKDAAAGSSSSTTDYHTAGRASTCYCSADPYNSNAVAPAGAFGISSNGSSSSSSSRRCSWCQHQQQFGATASQHVQILELVQASQRPRSVSCKRCCFFQWHVDLGAIRQLYEEVAAAGSRDSRILRSPAHSYAGYEWALQLEITQTRGATGFDGSKPWALGVFLTCQVRVEVPNKQATEAPPPAAAAACDASGSSSSSSGSSETATATGDCTGAGTVQAGCSGSKAGLAAAAALVLPPPLLMQLVDFGFVSTAATISVREVGGGKDKRCEKSWDHATVRYRASWGWPNYLDVQATGWDESAFERWVIDGQMHLQASVRVLG